MPLPLRRLPVRADYRQLLVVRQPHRGYGEGAESQHLPAVGRIRPCSACTGPSLETKPQEDLEQLVKDLTEKLSNAEVRVVFPAVERRRGTKKPPLTDMFEIRRPRLISCVPTPARESADDVNPPSWSRHVRPARPIPVLPADPRWTPARALPLPPPTPGGVGLETSGAERRWARAARPGRLPVAGRRDRDRQESRSPTSRCRAA